MDPGFLLCCRSCSFASGNWWPYTEHSVGTLLMELGAEHMGQMCDLEQARRLDDTVREGLRASLAASIERWPLPSLLEDLESSRARNELTWLRAFTGHAELP